MTPEELRQIMTAASEIEDARTLALTTSLLLVGAVLWLVWRRKLKEEYTPIWMACAAGLLVLSLRLEWLRQLADWLGAWTASSAVFFMGEAFLVILCLNYAVRLSRNGTEIKNLAQKIAILQAQVDELESQR